MQDTDSPAVAPDRARRASEVGLLAVACGIAAALFVALATSYVQSRQASSILVRGEGQRLLFEVRAALADGPWPPDQDDLRRTLDGAAHQGLRYAALVRPGGAVVLWAGTLSGPPVHSWGLTAGEVAGSGELARGLSQPLAFRELVREAAEASVAASGRESQPELRRRRVRQETLRKWPRGRFSIAIEFVPVLADQALRTARTTLAVGLLAFVALILSSLWAGRLLRHRDLLIRQLEWGRHVKTLGEMSAVIAHEIRNPLASLKGHAQLLEASLAEDSPLRAKAGRVVAETVRLEGLTSELLAFVRSGDVSPKDVDPAVVLRDAASGLDAGRIELRTEGAPDRWNLDPERMRQVLSNLLDNALQAADEVVQASVGSEAGSLVYEVRDRGSGIAPGDEERIFEPFFTRKTRGTGLGLAVARRIVASHRGTLSVANHPGGGALFRVRIPAS